MSGSHLDAVEELATRVVKLLQNRPAGLVSDLDGTLSAITWPPEAATIDDRTKAHLSEIAGAGVIVSVVTGRMVLDARRIVGLTQVEYWGQHGQQRWVDGEVVTLEEAAAFQPDIESAVERVRSLPASLGIAIEDKGIGAAFHVRESPDPDGAERAIVAELESSGIAAKLKIIRGRMVIEVRPPIDWNKGDALRRVVESHQLRSVVFLGDDTTDLDAVLEVIALRRNGHVEGLAIAVANPETPSPLASEADAAIDGVDEVERLLGEVSRRLNRPVD